LTTQNLVFELTKGTFKRRDFQKDTRRGFYLKEESLARFLNWFEGQTERVLEKLSETLAEFSILFEELK